MEQNEEPKYETLYDGTPVLESSLYSAVEEDEEGGGVGEEAEEEEAGNNYVGEGDSHEDDSEGQQSERRDGKEEEKVGSVPGVVREWLAELQQLGDVAEHVARLGPAQTSLFDGYSQLFQDFRETAKNVGRTIISEMHLPDEAKTIRPVSLGGVAGGRKLVHSGILFKFAADARLPDNSFMYGGQTESLAKANKACGHELKSLDAFYNASLELGISSLHVPLMALVDYRGSRLVALSFLPISGDTLVLGSNDGRNCVHRDLEAAELTGIVCNQSLGLLPHKVGLTTVPGPGDLEVHRGHDSKLYVLDFARLFPPEYPPKGSKLGRTIFYELLRPELVRHWWQEKREALCSDALSGWGRSDPDWKAHNSAVLKASVYLREERVPFCAAELDKVSIRMIQYGRVSIKDVVWMFQNISSQFHRFGVNLRHLGSVRNASTHAFTRMLLLTAMVARACKGALLESLRLQASKLKVSYEIPFQMTVLNYLNVLRGLGSTESINFWTKDVWTLLELKYGQVELIDTDLKGLGRPLTSRDLSARVCIPLLTQDLMVQTGYSWATNPLAQLESEARRNDRGEIQMENVISPANGVLREPQTQIIETDLSSTMQPLVTMSNLAMWAQGRSALGRALDLSSNMLFGPALEMFRASRRALESAIASVHTNSEIHVDHAFCLWKTYLLQSALNIDESGLRPLLKLAWESIEEASRLGCVSTRFLTMKVVVGLSSNIVFRNSTRNSDPRMDFYTPTVLRETLHQCFRGRFQASLSGFEKLLSVEPITSHLGMFVVLLLLFDFREMDGTTFREEFLHKICVTWLTQMHSSLEVSQIVSWCGAAAIIGEGSGSAPEAPAGSLMTSEEWVVGRVLHFILSEALAIPRVKANIEQDLVSLSIETASTTVLSNLLSLPLRGLYAVDGKTHVVTRESAGLITPDDEVYGLARRFANSYELRADSKLWSLAEAVHYLELRGDSLEDFRRPRCALRSVRCYPTCAVQSFSHLRILRSTSGDSLDLVGLKKIVSEARKTLSRVELLYGSAGGLEARHLTELCGLENLKELVLEGFSFSESRPPPAEEQSSAERALQMLLASHKDRLESLEISSCQFPDTWDQTLVPPMTTLKSLNFSTNARQPQQCLTTLLEEKLVTLACTCLFLQYPAAKLKIPISQLVSLRLGDACSAEFIASLLGNSLPVLQELSFQGSGFEKLDAAFFATLSAKLPAVTCLKLPQMRNHIPEVWNSLAAELLPQLSEFTSQRFFFDECLDDGSVLKEQPSRLETLSIDYFMAVPPSIWRQVCASPVLQRVSLTGGSGRRGAVHLGHLAQGLAQCRSLNELELSLLDFGPDTNSLVRGIMVSCPLLAKLKLCNISNLTEDLFVSILEEDSVRQQTRKAICRLKKLHIDVGQTSFNGEVVFSWIFDNFHPSDLCMEELSLNNYSPLMWLHVRRFQAKFPSIKTTHR